MSIRPLTLIAALIPGCFLWTAPIDAQVDIKRTRVGEIQPHTISTAHPYAGGTEQVFEIHHPGATYVKVHFERFELAPRDRLIISNLEGTESYELTGRGYKNRGEDFWGTSILGDTAVLRLQSSHSAGGYGFDVDYYAYGIVELFPPDPNEPESICGADNAMDIECYALSNPTEYDRAQRTVVVLFNGIENCTGFKVGCPNQIMSNEHCVTNQAEVDLTEVRFEYKRPGCATGTPSFSVAYLGDQFQQDDFTLDYVLFTVLGESAAYEAVELEQRRPPIGEPIYISGHPAGTPMKLSIEDDNSPTGLCQVDLSPTNGRGTNTDIGYYCDTRPGSSGSPVWSGVTHKVVALHHFGGCANGGVRMDLIYPLVESALMSCCDNPPDPLTIDALANGDNRIDVSWDDSSLAGVTAYHVKRSRTQGGPYALVAAVPDSSMGVGGGAPYVYNDTDVSGGTPYYYIVEATDGVQCTSDPSNEAGATATGQCTLPPMFDGVVSVTAPVSLICALDVSWNAATPECGGPVAYNLYRSTTPAFDPGPGNLVASGVPTTGYQDSDQLMPLSHYFYKVRAVDTANAAEDGNQAQTGAVPASGCTTASDCSDNPIVDVTPDGPLTVCENGGPTLTANLTGGVAPFQYQWLEDGTPVAGETGSQFTPDELGTHAYNVRVQADTCPDVAIDFTNTDLTRVNRPFFGGIGTATNPEDPVCTVNLDWNAATTVCPGPIEYAIYRDTVAPVAQIAQNLIASGVTGTGYTDTAGLVSNQTYYYNVQAFDLSTGQFDGNTLDIAITPTGANNGQQTYYLEDFTDPLTINDWTITTGPGGHNCGAWDIASAGASIPVQSSGNYLIADNRGPSAGGTGDCTDLFPQTSATATSPPIDLVIAGLQSVTLQINVRFNYDAVNGEETGAIDVWDGTQWINLWSSAAADVNQQMSWDVTTHAANNPGFMVRFDYQGAVNASAQQYFSFDEVTVITDVMAVCTTATPGPLPVGAGSLAADRLAGDATTLDLSWDAASCPTTDYNLLYGDLADVASYALLGSECSMGTSGGYTWNGVPAGDLYFLLVGTDGAGTESSWGLVNAFSQRNGATASNQCGNATKDVTGSCP